jgi:cytochrome o ubiquinol oxidase subunit 2
MATTGGSKKVVRRNLARFLLVLVLVLLTGCSSVVLFHPKGQVGHEEKRVILTTAGLMLIVVVPVIVLTPLFAWRFRASKWRAEYARKKINARALDAAFWLVPAGIVIALGFMAWNMSHKLDPFRPITSPRSDPTTIQVVSLDWKWLFIYPDQQIASVNEVAFPVNVPVHFLITSATVMNSFFIPQLGSQIYAMAGMQSELYLIADTEGTYAGISANISGIGFTGMSFAAHALPPGQFDAWVRAARGAPAKLDAAEYSRLAKPSQNNPVAYYSSVEPKLFSDIVGEYSYAHGGHEQMERSP